MYYLLVLVQTKKTDDMDKIYVLWVCGESYTPETSEKRHHIRVIPTHINKTKKLTEMSWSNVGHGSETHTEGQIANK